MTAVIEALDAFHNENCVPEGGRCRCPDPEDRFCPECQKYRPTVDDYCVDCGSDT